jgi:hypothetical protein
MAVRSDGGAESRVQCTWPRAPYQQRRQCARPPRSRQQSPHHAFDTSSRMRSAGDEAIGAACKVPKAATKTNAAYAEILPIIVETSAQCLDAQ